MRWATLHYRASRRVERQDIRSSSPSAQRLLAAGATRNRVVAGGVVWCRSQARNNTVTAGAHPAPCLPDEKLRRKPSASFVVVAPADRWLTSWQEAARTMASNCRPGSRDLREPSYLQSLRERAAGAASGCAGRATGDDRGPAAGPAGIGAKGIRYFRVLFPMQTRGAFALYHNK